MLPSHELDIRQLELQNKINQPRYSEIQSDEDDAQKRLGERTALMEELLDVRLKLIEATRKEARDAEIAMARNVDTDGWSPELRDFRDLAQKTDFEVYVKAGAALRHLPKGSAEEEYNQHVLGASNIGDVPLEMFLDRDEKLDIKPHEVEEMRTVITGVAADAGNLTFVDRIMAASDGAYVGATYPSVGPGRHSYPIVTSRVPAAEFARDANETPAGGISIVNADPTRIQRSYEVAKSDELQMPGIGAALLRHIRQALVSGLDNKVIDDLISGLTDPSANTTVETLPLIMGRYGAAVDGIGAKDVREVRLLVGTTGGGTAPTRATYDFANSLALTSVGTFMTLIPHDRFRGSSHIAVTAAKNQDGIAYRTGAPGRRTLIAPVWRTAEILRDTGRLQTRGQVTLTGALYADVIVANSDLHAKLDFRVQA